KNISNTMTKIRDSVAKTNASLTEYEKRMTAAIRRTRQLRRIGSFGLTRITLPLAALGAVAIKQAANMETATLRMQAFVGSAEKAKKVVADLQQMSVRTPFSFEDLEKTAKGL